MTKLKKTYILTKLKNQIVPKLKNSNCDSSISDSSEKPMAHGLLPKQKSRIRETPTLSIDADSKTDTI